MSERRNPIASGNAEFDKREAERLRQREEEGLEPERHPGPRPLEGISSAGQLYFNQEEADRASPVHQGVERTDVDRAAARVLGDPHDDDED